MVGTGPGVEVFPSFPTLIVLFSSSIPAPTSGPASLLAPREASSLSSPRLPVRDSRLQKLFGEARILEAPEPDSSAEGRAEGTLALGLSSFLPSLPPFLPAILLSLARKLRHTEEGPTEALLFCPLTHTGSIFIIFLP